MNKIQRLSRILRALFSSCCWLLPIFTAILMFFYLDEIIEVGLFKNVISFPNKIYLTDFSFSHKFILFLVQLLPLSITIFICHLLAKLFRLFEQGHLFEMENIAVIRKIGILMLIGQMIQLLFYQPLMSFALSYNNPVGHRFITLSLGTTNMTSVITAVIILLAAWIVKEAHQLKTESQLTI